MNNVHVKPENDSTASSPVIAVDRPIPVMEIFGPTVQGEGMVVGRKTMFVRTAGRDYRRLLVRLRVYVGRIRQGHHFAHECRRNLARAVPAGR